jgi:hypothetical protein
MHCPEQPCSPHSKLHVYRPLKPQTFWQRSLPSQTVLTWDPVNGTGIDAGAKLSAGFFALSSRHFATQSLSVIPAAWLKTLFACHSISQVAEAFLWAKDDVGNAITKQTAEYTINMDPLAITLAIRPVISGMRNFIIGETGFMAHLPFSIPDETLSNYFNCTA